MTSSCHRQRRSLKGPLGRLQASALCIFAPDDGSVYATLPGMPLLTAKRLHLRAPERWPGFCQTPHVGWVHVAHVARHGRCFVRNRCCTLARDDMKHSAASN